jgi:hypothetical protein
MEVYGCNTCCRSVSRSDGHCCSQDSGFSHAHVNIGDDVEFAALLAVEKGAAQPLVEDE